jgi:Zinc-finger associated domain (zf-AD)
MNVCRLCGDEKSPLDFNVELNDQTASNWSYRELVEHHTRVALKTNKLLPQGVCEECRIQVDSFAEFSNKLQALQNTFDIDDEEQDLPMLTENFTQVHPLLELIPETIIKEQEDSEDTSNSESEEVSDRKGSKVRNPVKSSVITFNNE